jgi:hypothetical protein
MFEKSWQIKSKRQTNTAGGGGIFGRQFRLAQVAG